MSQSATATEKAEELLAIVAPNQSFVVTSHARPDGDAIGSALGFMHLLESMGKQVTVVFADPIPLVYQALPGAARIVNSMPAARPQVAVLLECDSFERAGFTAADFAGIPCIVNIDHHVSGKNYGDYNWIDPQCCAVGAMIYDIAIETGTDIHCDMATCLYTAVLTDTGSFTYSSTVASTFELAEHLVRCGAKPNRIAQAVYFSNPASKLFLLAEALGNLTIDGPVALTWVTQEQIIRAGAGIEDTEGVVNYLIGIAGVEAAVFLRELPADEGFRLSMRSKGLVDVSTVAASLGGGGHRNASGCNLALPLSTAKQTILDKLHAAVPPAGAPRANAPLC